MVKIRLMHVGRLHQGSFRLVACDERSQRDGNHLEMLGTYNPRMKDPVKQLTLNAERVVYWLSVGAQPTLTASKLLKQKGIKVSAVRAELKAARAAAAEKKA